MEIAWEGWLLVGIGVWAIIDGIRFHLGVSRSWFYVIAIPGIMMPNMMFGSIPIGVGSLILGLLILVEQDSWLFEKTGPLMWYVMGLCFVLAAIFWVFKPRFIQPKWYRWLWKHHGAIMPELKKDAERLGKEWLDRTRTQAGLEQWALEVRNRL